MKRMFVATAIVLAIVVMAFTAPAKADISFVGIGSTGLDSYGNTWLWNSTVGGYTAGVPAGNAAWGIPGLGQGEATWSGPVVDDFAFQLGTAFTTMTIEYLPNTSGSGYNETTRMSVDGILWNRVAVSPTEVEFFAPTPAADLVAGDGFFVNVILDGPINPSLVGFVGTYSFPSAVPIPGAALLFGPGLAGLALIRRRFKK